MEKDSTPTREFITPVYASLEFDVIIDRRLNNTDKMIYAIINTCTNNKNKTCFLSNRYISDILDIDISTVKRSISKLKELHYLLITKNSKNKRLIKTTIAKFVEMRKEEYCNQEDTCAIVPYEDFEEIDWLNE